MLHRHLDYPPGTPVHELGPAAIDDVLERGDLESWSELAAAVRSDPFGALAERVLRLVDAHRMYGTSNLWRSWIERLRGIAVAHGLRELRAGCGLTQEELAGRLRMSQSDVSKLERRHDVRLSSLRRYVAATGGRLQLRARYGERDVEIMLD
jgi:hypothetical protein